MHHENDYQAKQAAAQVEQRRVEGVIGADMRLKPEAADPWRHRSAGMRCKTCMWFAPKEAARPVTPNAYDVGRCRRHAPSMAGYPVVFVNDWCGDHRLDENKF